jgi:hypothetical protein
MLHPKAYNWAQNRRSEIRRNRETHSENGKES